MSAFDRIIGYESVKEKLRNYADCLANPKKYEDMGVRLPKGILLDGEPGLGKTLMAVSLMKESGRNSFIIRKYASDGDFIDIMHETVEEAANDGPSIVLFDDMDRFSNEDDSHRNTEEYVAIQALIDEYSDKGVFFVATVNSMENLPESLLRPGRFDSLITLYPPLGEDSERIIEHYLSKQKLAADVDREMIARVMHGRSCAELENVINEAGVYAAFKGKNKVDQESFLHACLKDLFRDDSYSLDEAVGSGQEQLMYYIVHEVGHALISEVLDPGSVNLVKIRVGDYGDVKGVTSLLDRNQEKCLSDVERKILVKLGGKAATEVVLGETDMGCESDLHQVAASISSLVTDLNHYGFHTGWRFRSNSIWSDNNRDQIATIEEERYYREAKSIISKNREFFDRMVSVLKDRNILTFRDIQGIRERIENKERIKQNYRKAANRIG